MVIFQKFQKLAEKTVIPPRVRVDIHELNIALYIEAPYSSPVVLIQTEKYFLSAAEPWLPIFLGCS